jgi:hypothetical protein
MQEYDGKLNFATDAWSLPNHKAFVAVSVHFEYNREPVSMVLDVVEVARWAYIYKFTIQALKPYP